MIIGLSGLDLDFLNNDSEHLLLQERMERRLNKKLHGFASYVRSDLAMPYIAPDRTEYKSVITGEQITSRNQHREHLKQHGCEEVGNEKIDIAPAREKVAKSMKATLAQDIKEAKEQVEAGYVAPEVKQKEFEIHSVSSNIKTGDIVRNSISKE